MSSNEKVEESEICLIKLTSKNPTERKDDWEKKSGRDGNNAGKDFKYLNKVFNDC